MGFVSTPELGHEAIELGARALARLAHRGGLDADGKSGDGAGLLIQVPQRLLGGEFAVVCVFEWDERALPLIAQAMGDAGMQSLAWRRVPVDASSLGVSARERCPASGTG
jgi:glutamate synthase domain-containing protein 1